MSFDMDRSKERIDAAKRKARPELNRFGWDTLNYHESFNFPKLVDNIAREDATNMTTETFRAKYEIPRVPCILTGLTNTWRAQEKWNTERLLRKYRNQRFKCGEDDKGYSVKMKMKYYIDYMKNNIDDSPLYIFDSGFGSRKKVKKLLDDYEVPEMFKDDLFNYANFEKRPPHRWFVMGPPRSGTNIHIDPLGTSAWNSLIKGHKRWVLIHPDAPKVMIKPLQHEKGKHPDEAVTWFRYVYYRVKANDWPKEFPIIEARQGPGETMFVPSGWWHVVINEDETIAITQNFCSLVNLRHVWPKTVKGRPKLSKHWYRRLKKARPECIPIMDEALESEIVENSSSDSSSSSSSSSDSEDTTSDDDDDSGYQRSSENGLTKKRKLCDEQTNSFMESVCYNKLRRSPTQQS
ncbi:unnamed protein product [Auanema sp. JU1783]|nr:unnamed protein product [Auanema sp. JU1783]